MIRAARACSRYVSAVPVALALASLLGAQKPRANAKAPAQPRKECNVNIVGVTVNGVPSHAESFGTSTGQHNTFYGGGFDARCAGTDQRIRSDSAEQYGDEKRLILLGNVHYTEVRVKLDSDKMTYFTGDERLIAEGNVRGVTKTGTRFLGPRAEYLRVAKGVRDRSRLTAESRPNVWLSPTDAGSSAKDSTHLQADQVISDNDSLVYAKGKVIIDRPDLVSTSDSAFIDNGREFLRLVYTPKLVGRGERKFTLEGDVIDAYSKQRKVQRVRSSQHARATSEDVLMTADTIDLRITAEKLSRAFAWGPSHARAKSRDQDLTADSIDVLMPAQQLREMHAIRRAMAASVADTTKIISKENDWLRGDTIVAHFDSAASGDTSSRPAVRQIVARGAATPASSFYQVAPGGVGKTDKPNVNYVTGRQITVDFRDRKVESVTVKGSASGFYVEAVPDSTRVKAPADSTSRPPAPSRKAKGTKP